VVIIGTVIGVLVALVLIRAVIWLVERNHSDFEL
jgi:hypothetical protein